MPPHSGKASKPRPKRPPVKLPAKLVSIMKEESERREANPDANCGDDIAIDPMITDPVMSLLEASSIEALAHAGIPAEGASLAVGLSSSSTAASAAGARRKGSAAAASGRTVPADVNEVAKTSHMRFVKELASYTRSVSMRLGFHPAPEL